MLALTVEARKADSPLTIELLQLRMNALAFPFVADGIPIMYSGAEQEYEGGEPAEKRFEVEGI